MNARNSLFTAALLGLLAAPAFAQDSADTAKTKDEGTAIVPVGAHAGLNAFEAPKYEGPFDGIRVNFGGAFTMNFQALNHSNTAAPNLDANGVDLNKLASIRPGVNLPSANLNLGVQLAPGINMVLQGYMSSRHHNEFWVKGGYATIDQSPINSPFLNSLMEYTTIRAGMYEPNYGDALYRRSDNGNTLSNPFAENLILDAFTTEPGADVLVRLGDAFVMGGITTGQNKGDVVDGAVDARPALLGKVGFDRQMNDALRVRLSGSVYSVSETPRTTLYAGDRSGSNYWGVIDNAAATAFTNGRLSAAFPNELTAIQINPFVKLGGLELFGVLERAEGKAASEATSRTVNQYAGDAVYRFLSDKLYVAGRYNVVTGNPTAAPSDDDVTIDRKVLSAGWFISPNMLTKVEYVRQNYDGFASTDIRNGAEFDGFVVQGSIAF
jgi:hypothetical protein